mmetsp:Transcript_6344/g.25573  ORF Transcript_6344/g.25573 Transcript_6344/m.25573 type:complete len:361 (-) Transcript_6344:3531-4613(-)
MDVCALDFCDQPIDDLAGDGLGFTDGLFLRLRLLRLALARRGHHSVDYAVDDAAHSLGGTVGRGVNYRVDNGLSSDHRVRHAVFDLVETAVGNVRSDGGNLDPALGQREHFDALPNDALAAEGIAKFPEEGPHGRAERLSATHISVGVHGRLPSLVNIATHRLELGRCDHVVAHVRDHTRLRADVRLATVATELAPRQEDGLHVLHANVEPLRDMRAFAGILCPCVRISFSLGVRGVRGAALEWNRGHGIVKQERAVHASVHTRLFRLFEIVALGPLHLLQLLLGELALPRLCVEPNGLGLPFLPLSLLGGLSPSLCLHVGLPRDSSQPLLFSTLGFLLCPQRLLLRTATLEILFVLDLL